MRLARGYAPLSIPLEESLPEPILAVGAQQKSTVAIAFGKQVIVSPYIGENQTIDAVAHFQNSVKHISEIYDFKPGMVIHDLHKNYASTQYANQLVSSKKWDVQHHFAHVLSQIAANKHSGSVLGFTFDGTGLGTDGTLWGGEALLADQTGFTRIAHLSTFKLIGGEQAIKDPTRTLLSLLFERHQPDAIEAMKLPALQNVSSVFIRNLYRLWQTDTSCIETSSVGRLFDAVARLLNLVWHTRYEGEAGMMLETAAHECTPETGVESDAAKGLVLSLPLIEVDGQKIWDTHTLFDQILHATQSSPLTDHRVSQIADSFISALAHAVCSLSASCQKDHSPIPVTLCGGVFQNRLLLAKCNQQLQRLGVTQLPRKLLPVNDAGIALGQSWYGMHRC